LIPVSIFQQENRFHFPVVLNTSQEVILAQKHDDNEL
jgi:hypothetical protein